MATDFDEYEYLEKEVEAAKDKEHRSSRRREKTDGEAKLRPSRSEGREKDREHRSSRELAKGRARDYRDRERDHGANYRERERLRERERDEEKRSSSRSRREAEREMERARSRDRASRERVLEREREMGTRKFKDKKEAMESEADPERDQRTVFAYQMPLKATERDVYEFFSQVGKVRDVRVIMDRNSRRSKGVGYIEFYDAMSVPAAIALSGHLLLGQPVMVKPSEAEKNLAQSNTTGGSAVVGAAALRKLYVGNLHFSITEEQLREIFESFGPVELVQLPLDLETGQCRGYGFIQFAQLEHAKAAQTLNGKLDIAGRMIKVSAVTDHVGVQDPGANAADFDDEDAGPLFLNANSRASLMKKLDRTGIASSIADSLVVPMLNGAAPNQVGVGSSVNGNAALTSAVPVISAPSIVTEPVGEPSECLLLKNMFDPSTETEPDFDMDIKEDVQEECSKFGPLQHIHVDKHSNGFVYLRFHTTAAASGCQRAMHGRWFAGRAVSATFVGPRVYEAKFDGSK